MSSEVPQFPLEILDLIINYVGNNEDQPLCTGQTRALWACSLASRTLYHLCRPHIFRVLDVYFYDSEAKDEKLTRFSKLLKLNPSTSALIMDLRINLRVESPCPALVRNLGPFLDYALNLPKLQSLSIVDTYMTGGGSDRQVPHTRNHSWMQAVCKSIVASYTSHPGLRRLKIIHDGRVRSLPSTENFTCPSITELHLAKLLHAPNYYRLESRALLQVEKLTIDSCAAPWYSLLHKCPNLTHLTLSGSFNGTQSLPAPICKLKYVELKCKQGPSSAMGLLWKTNHLEFKPIDSIEKLELRVAVQRELGSIGRNLQDLTNLLSLSIEIPLPNEESDFSHFFDDLELGRLMTSSFLSLASISVSCWLPTLLLPKSMELQRWNDSLAALMASVSSTPTLRTFKLTISKLVQNDVYLHHDQSLFSIIEQVFVCASRVTDVEEVEIVLAFAVPQDDTALNTAILTDRIFLPQLREKILQIEKNNRLKLHLFFSSIKETPSGDSNPIMTTRTVSIRLYPKQNIQYA